MLDKFKQMNQLRNIQNELGKEKVEEEKRGVRIVMNGKMQVEEVSINPDLETKEQGEALKECFNSVTQKVQMMAARKMQEMGAL